MKWAIIGSGGFIAPRHFKSILEIGDEVILTCDIDEAKQADFMDYEVMMQSERWKEVGGVAICAPNNWHYQMCEAMKDKIVICEKPLTLSSKKMPEKAFTVLQLRYHPEVLRLKNELKGKHKVNLVVKVKRDKSYWESWKGFEKLSGGILFNLGIHYFDLLIYLFGDDYKIYKHSRSDNQANGRIKFQNADVRYYLEIMSDNEGQDRYLEIDGEKISLSKQDNLSFENLHTKVYEAVKAGKGIPPSEVVKSIKLVEKLK